MKRLRAFTLIELLIASAISLVVMATIYSAFHTGIFGYGNIEKTSATYQSARQILERINLDLRNSFAYSNIDSKFQGTRNEVNFLTLVDTYIGDNIVRDFASVSYRSDSNKLTLLCRRNQDSLLDKSPTQPDEMASNVEEIIFSYGYIDENDKTLKFKTSWAGQDAPGEKKLLPVAVKVELVFKDKTNQGFSRTIFLLLAS